MPKELFEKILNEEITNRERMTIRLKGFIGRGINGVNPMTLTNDDDYSFEFVECCEDYFVCKYGYKPYIRTMFIPYEQVM